MISPAALRRPVAGLAVVALALGAAGCGGSDEGGDGGADAGYAGTWNEVCTSFTSAQTTLQGDVAKAQKAAGDRSAAEQKKVNVAAMTRFFDSSSAALKRAQGLDAPEDFRRFQAQADKALPDTISVLEDLKGPLATGDPKAIQSVVGRLDPTQVFPAIPADLKSQAGACSVY